MIELWQTEWCPASHRVRQRLTELGVDCLLHQVPVQPDDRDALQEIAGSRTIPVMRVPDGETVAGEQEIMDWLQASVPEPAEAAAQRAKAGKALERLLAEHSQKEHA